MSPVCVHRGVLMRQGGQKHLEKTLNTALHQSKQMKNVWESNCVEKVSNCSRGIVTSQSVLFSKHELSIEFTNTTLVLEY